MSIFVSVMVGVAIWHFSVLVPDRFYGGIVGAFAATVIGALLSGYLLPSPGIPPHNPPGVTEALWPVPGAILALVCVYVYGARRESVAQVSQHGAPDQGAHYARSTPKPKASAASEEA